jgi:ubiquinone biosynthesis accessory factor UbiK
MANPRFIDEINARLSEVLARSPAKDVEKNVRAGLSTLFTRLDLVTREEFDVQAKVLERTREKLTAMEGRLAELEQKLKA